ncbi:MAG: prephenate dehydrogenase/arogenate dehydrogenase family protein [Nitrospirota bacterium]
MAILFKQMTVIGVGLIGGSFALAAKKAKLTETVVGYGKKRGDLHKAASMGAVDRFFLKLSKAVESADIIVLATPVATFEPIVSMMAPYLKKGAIVTDVGSVKGELVSKIESLLAGRATFVGGHPMAGLEKSGIQFAKPTLFDKNLTILTPTAMTDSKALKKVAALWEGMGAKVVKLDPKKHDQIMSVVSHLPHLVAYTLMEVFSHPRMTKLDPLPFSAGSLRDFSRVAESSPELWSQIFRLNKTAVIEAIDLYQETLEKLKKTILAADKGKETDLLTLLTKAQVVRKRING